MSTIHFVGGEKGGVGKSVVSRLMSQYFLEKSKTFSGFDADQSHSTLTRFYPEFTQPVNLDIFESTDQIMERALEDDQQVIIDLPAQSERFLNRWIEENGVLDMCEEMDISIIYWYVVDDGIDSANLIDSFLTQYYANKNQGNLKFVAVKNQGRGTNFTAVDAAISKHAALHSTTLQQAILPGLHKETMRKIDTLNFSFWGAENIKDKNLQTLSLMERQRTRVWLKKSYAMLNTIFTTFTK